MEVLRMTTGEKIRYFRTSHELTQEQLASQSGLSISALQKYESDERKPKPEQLLKISDALGISINIFMDFDIRTVSDLFSLLFRMEEQINLRFYKDTTTDTVGIYFENEYITEKISSYAEMLREIDTYQKIRKIRSVNKESLTTRSFSSVRSCEPDSREPRHRYTSRFPL